MTTPRHADPDSNGVMRSVLLDLAYGTVLVAASPFLLYRLRTSERYRAGLAERLGSVSPRAGGRRCLWLHAASVGEVQACRPLVQKCRGTWPDLDLVISTQTLSGRRLAEQACPGCRVLTFPLDLSPIAGKVLDRIRPDCVALVEREIWPNFITAAARRNVPVLQVNGRITLSSLQAYRWLYPVIGPALQAVACFGVQTEEYAERLRALAVPSGRIEVTGNLKYDSVPLSVPDAEQARLRQETGLRPGEPVWVCGSIHPGEEGILVRAYQSVRRHHPALRLVLAPRHLEKLPELERSVAALGESTVRKSVRPFSGLPETPGEAKILMLDTMGELRALYSLATVVFVGGTLMPVGGHNLLEPAALGKPVLFGPHVFQQEADAQALVAAEAAVACGSADRVAKRLLGLFNDPAGMEAMGQRARAVFRAHQGAARKTLELLRQFIEEGKHKP
ncbi:MAG: 3-deoxy-D-manno-octulosonic acid transferase [Planctomycetes bacterium]|nr:3-deoxy-D-manno-octulosonic acid transferase [Planctomycetota bacterium]